MTPLHGSSGTFLLFVYGTLKRGGIRHGPLGGQRHLGPATTLPRYALIDLGDYPGLVERPEDGQAVHGELYEVSCGLLDWLDAVESAPELFRLGPVELAGQTAPAWAYFYVQETGDRPRIESGRWDPPRGE